MNPFGCAPVRRLWAPRGALFFTHGSSLLSKAIRWAERDPRRSEGNSWANHVGLVTSTGYLTNPNGHTAATVSEALWTIKHHQWWEAHKHENVAIAIFVWRDYIHADDHYIKDNEVDLMVADALTRTGQRYAWWRLFSFLGERFTRIPFSKLHLLKDRNVCSNHAGLACEAGGRKFPEAPGSLDPDDMMDFAFAGEALEFAGWSVVAGR